MLLSSRQFKAIFPSAPASYLAPLQEAMDEFQISATWGRMEMFLAQIDHESGDLAHMVENLNYSADGLANTWPNRYGKVGANGKVVKETNAKGQVRVVPNALATKIARNPQAIANNCYANRMGNGDEASGDGWAYRGRGPIMNTGKEKYILLQRVLGIPLVTKPELLEQPEAGFRAAGYHWFDNGCNELADAGKFEAVTREINGGLIGLEDRKRLLDIVRKELNRP